VWISVKFWLYRKSRKERVMVSWIRNFARSRRFRRETGRVLSKASREVFIFHLLIGRGIGSTGSERIRRPVRQSSVPPGARDSRREIPSASTVAPSFRDLREKPEFISSKTHCTSPSYLRRIRKEISPIFRIL